jgi:hypothetical protein
MLFPRLPLTGTLAGIIIVVCGRGDGTHQGVIFPVQHPYWRECGCSVQSFHDIQLIVVSCLEKPTIVPLLRDTCQQQPEVCRICCSPNCPTLDPAFVFPHRQLGLPGGDRRLTQDAAGPGDAEVGHLRVEASAGQEQTLDVDFWEPETRLRGQPCTFIAG